MRKVIASLLSFALTFGMFPLPVLAAPGDTLQTPVTPMELPIEVEIELSPAGSLKHAPLWKELFQMLDNPYAPVERRPGFGVAMPPLNVYPLDYNFLTAQPMRLRTVDGEVSWDVPGPLFDPAEVVPVDAFNTPTDLRTPIGALVGSDDDVLDAGEVDGTAPCTTCGYLLVSNPGADPAIPPDGTIVAVPAVVGGVLQQLDPVPGTTTIDIAELEIPINEEDFFRDPADTSGVATELQPYIGRPGAEVLGKALFWDMQVGSDGVQACGSCHFHAGVDNRTRNQLNPNHLGGDIALQVAGPNMDVIADDFPFHQLANPEISGESTSCGLPGLPACADPNVVSDTNDVMSSMGVVFRTFVDIPTPGPGAFAPPVGGVAPLLPDIGTADPDPLGAVFQNLRRVEPRNTPTFHGAAFNLDNFWDGRARFNFNGGSVFGPSDPQFHVFFDNGGVLEGASNGHVNPELLVENPEMAAQPVRIKFSSLASQAVGPPLSEFEMSFFGRNWAKIGKKLLQAGVTPLANQLVATDDSRLGEFSNQGGTVCTALGRPTAAGMPGLCVSYPELVEAAFTPEYWGNSSQHLNGTAVSILDQPDAGGDPFDGYVLSVAPGECTGGCLADTNQFNQMEANFSLIFGLSVQAYESLTIPDDTPADRFFDANPLAGHAVGEPGDQAVLFPTLVPDLLDDGILNNSAPFPTPGALTLIPDDPSTPEYDGFGPDEIFGFDLFAGGNLTAGLPAGTARNPLRTITTEGGAPLQIAVGSNPFTRSAKCMLCHLGPEQTDHSINISHGLLKNDAEFEYPTPPFAADPAVPSVFVDGLLPAPEPSGSSRSVGGLILAEEVEETPQDAVEVEPRNFATFDDPATPWDDRIIAQPANFAFGDQGIYNIGVRPIAEDLGRGGNDPFTWPLSLSALTLKNIGGPAFEPCDGPFDSCVMANFDPADIGAEAPGALQGFDPTGDECGLPDCFFPGTTHTLQSVNPGFERNPINPLMPEYMVPWINGLPAGELHPQIDEMAGMVPNTLTPPNGGPGIEFPEILFGADLHCGVYDPVSLGGPFNDGPPSFGWGPNLPFAGPNPCPNNQSGVAGNLAFPSQGTWPVPNRVLRDGAFKAPPLRNIELTGPYFHTGSYLTLRQVVDFYFRGGDFPMTNAENRDPTIVEVEEQAFAFGRTTGADLETLVNHVFSVDPPFTLEGYFVDGLPDTVFRFDAYPDSDHPYTPEPVFASRAAALEDAKNSLVKFLLALTDPRVKYERAPFDRPEIFVPVDGTAPDNVPLAAADTIGVYRQGNWFLDNGNGILDGCGVLSGDDLCLGPFGGNAQDVAVAGDWNNDGFAEVGIYRNGSWFLDNGDGVWSGCGAFPANDVCAGPFGGNAVDVPVAGDWDNDGAAEIGIYRNGNWFLDNGDGVWSGCGAFPANDVCAGPFGGNAADRPVIGDWDNDGLAEIGIYRNGNWFLDNGDGVWSGCGAFPANDVCTGPFGGNAADRPVAGDWNDDGSVEIGVFRNGTWYLDLNGNGTFNGCVTDGCYAYGLPTDRPVAGNFPVPVLSGRASMLADARFRHLPEVGQGGNLTPQPSFLGISSTPVPGPHNDHFDP